MRNKATYKNLEKTGNDSTSHYHINGGEKQEKYIVETKFVFKGFFEVSAESKEAAREKIMKHCGLVIGSDIHSNLCNDEIDWDFNVHPTKVIGRIKQLK